MRRPQASKYDVDAQIRRDVENSHGLQRKRKRRRYVAEHNDDDTDLPQASESSSSHDGYHRRQRRAVASSRSENSNSDDKASSSDEQTAAGTVITTTPTRVSDEDLVRHVHLRRASQKNATAPAEEQTEARQGEIKTANVCLKPGHGYR